MPDWSKIEQKISASIGQPFQLKKQAGIAGGDINQAHQIEGILVDENRSASFFIKSNQKSRLDMFEAEAEGLQEIEKAQAIRVPHVVCSGVAANQSYLVLENLKLARGAGGDIDSAKRLGQQLAAMHKTTSSQFGWSRDNTIGSTRQLNKQTDNWIDFWREQRLGFQLELANQNGCGQSLYSKGQKLLTELEQFFTDYEPEASLLHGDLWSGNYGYLKEGDPVIFDPAVYYGDRETDIAMTELFGGFTAEFYSAYNQSWPLDKGYKQRKTLYNLYHVLNHFNLFGGGYAMQAENMIDRLSG
ncbi:MAG: fructosamine kinase family protein [Gammaproteobacteria bacterium]|nr:MAG: fructosamine kinase family protein [Gammaproteobacteria bacterium]